MTALLFTGFLLSVAALKMAVAVGGVRGTVFGIAVVVAVVLGGRALLRDHSPWRRRTPGEARDRTFLARIVLLGVLARAGVAVLLQATGWWDYLGGDEDTFHRNAVIFSRWLDGDSPYMFSYRFTGSLEVGYFVLTGSLYHCFGVDKSWPLLVNCVVGAGLAYPIHALATRLAGRAAGRRAALLVVFFPAFILWSSLVVRDIVVMFLIAALFLQVDRFRRAPGPWSLVLVLVPLLGIATLRTYIAVLLCAAVAGGLFLGRRSVGRSLLVGGGVMVAVILLFRFTGVGESELERANLEQMSRLRQQNALGPSVAGALSADVDISTPTAALTYLPVGLAYFFLSPFPWQVGSPRQAMSLADVLLWYSILPAVLSGLLWLLRRRFRAILPLLFAVIGISVLYSLVEGNIGIIFRHRSQVIMMLCAVAGVGHALRRRAAEKERRRRERPLPHLAPPGGPLGPPAGVRVPAGAP